MYPKDNTFAAVFILIILMAIPLSGQHFRDGDQSNSSCLITSITLQGEAIKHGTNVSISEMFFNPASDVDVKSVDLYLNNEKFLTGDFLSCGSHNIQARIAYLSDKLSPCNFTVIIKCSDKDCKLIEEKPGKSIQQRTGYMSAYWESGAKGAGAISSTNGDPGGKSYGTFQISARHGYIEDFLDNEGKFFKPLFKGLEIMSPAFDSIWKMIAIEEPELFDKRQHEFIDRTHYQVFCKRLKNELGMNPNNFSSIIKEVLWSTVVQHGPYNNIVHFALAGMDLEILSEKTIIELIYKERGLKENDRLFYYPRVDSKWQRNLINRFNKEKDFAISKLR